MNFANRYQQDYVRVMRPFRNGQRLTLKMDQEFFDVMQMDSSLVAISAVLRGVEATMARSPAAVIDVEVARLSQLEAAAHS